jgi:hypothetical protein
MSGAMKQPLRLAALLLLAATVPAVVAQPQVQDPRMPQTQEERQFHAAVSRAIYQIVPQERERFTLGLADRANPVLPGEGTNDPEPVPCEKLAAFQVLGYGNALGHITAATCKNGARVRELSAGSRTSLTAKLKDLSINEDQARRIGWYYVQETQSDGSDYYYFPVLALGHGVLAVLTGALYDKKTGIAVVVQAVPYPMCEAFRERYKESPMCTDMLETLRRIAQTLQGAP